MFISVESEKILKCRLKENQTIEFVNGLAVVNVSVTAINYHRERCEYDTVCLVEECRDDEGEVVGYRLANEGSSYFNLEKYVTGITRFGDDFIFEIRTGNDDATVTWSIFKQFHHECTPDGTHSFEFVGEIKSELLPTKNPDIGILNPDFKKKSLYSISKRETVGNSYSSIEDIDGNTFMVVDTVYSNKNGDLKDHLVFIIDKEGKRVTKISSRNDKMKEVPASLDEPYDEIYARVAAELDDLASIENEYIQQLRLEQGINK